MKQVKKRIQNLLPRNAFARGVSILMGGTIGAQALTMLVAPLLTRLYSPDDYGVMAVFGSLLMVLGVNACLRYEMAIPLPEEDQEAAHIVVLSLLIAIGVSLLAAAVLLFGGSWICDLLGVPALVDYIWLLPIGILLGAGYTVFNAWAVRTKAYSAIASTRLRQALATLMIQVGAYSVGALALLAAAIAGQSVGTLRMARKAVSGPEFKKVKRGGLVIVARRYHRFPLYSSWDGLLNVVSREFPPLIFAAVFGASSTGFYALANHVLSKPMSLIGGAIGQVFLSHAVVANREGTLGKLVSSLHEKLANFAMPPLALIVLQGPELFTLIFGAQWEQAGVYAQWMAPWMYLVCVSSPLSTVLTVQEEQKVTLMFQILLFATRAAAIVIGAQMGDMLTTVKLYSGVSSVVYLILSIMIFRMAGSSAREWLRATMIELGITCLLTLPLIIYLFLNVHEEHVELYLMAIVLLLVIIRYAVIVNRSYGI